MNIKVFFVLGLLWLTFSVKGQQLPSMSMTQKGHYYMEQKTFLVQNRSFELKAGIPFTSFVLQIDEGETFQGVFVILKSDTLALTLDEHAPRKNGRMNSNLVSIDGEEKVLNIYSGSLKGEVRLHLINSQKLQGVKKSSEPLPQVDCLTEPTNITQTNWRSGLPEPSYTRAFTDVNHVIVHHSAGSNTNNNYTQVVRDIYLYHTEVNGWSDIGYNYLIGQDGTIYSGRDPAGGAQDNVRGAHFCGMNSGTMGICLLGTYTTIEPTEEAIASLVNLAAWKLNKEGLNPLESFPFRAIPQLGAISGHREGCATECPGQMTFDRLTEFKNSINATLQSCAPEEQISADFSTGLNTIFEGESVSFTDGSFGSINSWNWAFDGGSPAESSEQNPSDITYATSGKYDVQLIVRSGARVDTLLKEGVVEVLETSEAINLYPNPVQRAALMTIKINVENTEPVVITNMSGKQVLIIHATSEKFSLDTSPLDKGIYMIHFFNGGEIGSKRFLVY